MAARALLAAAALAAAAFLNAQAPGPEDLAKADNFIVQGSVFYGQQKVEAALKRFEAALRIDQTAVPPRPAKLREEFFWIGACRYDLKELDRAREAFSAALVHAEALKDAEAIANLKGWLRKTEAVAAGPASKDPAELARKGRAAEAAGRRAEAGEAYCDAGLLYCEAGNYAEAEALGRKAMAIHEALGDQYMLAADWNNLGSVYARLGRYDDARDFFRKAKAANEKLGNRDLVSLMEGNIAYTYRSAGDYAEAVVHLRAAVAVDEEIKNDGGLVSNLNSLGSSLQYLGEREQSLAAYDRAERLAIGAGIENAYLLINMGTLFQEWGRYDRALAYYERGLRLARKNGGRDSEASALGNLGSLYEEWGKPDNAGDYYRQALKLNTAINRLDVAAVNQTNLGNLALSAGDAAGALSSILAARTLAEPFGDKKALLTIAVDAGVAYSRLGRNAEADREFKEAERLAGASGDKAGLAVVYANIAERSWESGNRPGAYAYYRKALDLAEALRDSPQTLRILRNLGLAYMEDGRAPEGEAALRRAVALAEGMRETASGSLRRDYLAQQAGIYRLLVQALLMQAKAAQAFDAAELASARFLADRLAGRQDRRRLEFSGIDAYRAGLDGKTLVLDFVDCGDGDWVVLAADKAGLAFGISSAADLVEPLRPYLAEAAPDQFGPGTRGLKVAQAAAAPAAAASRNASQDFAALVSLYRALLAKSAPTAKEKALTDRLAKAFQVFLFGPVEERLAGKTTLRIVPSGALSALPFETLKGADGRWAAERWDMKYAVSLTVQELVSKRAYGRRGSVLAFGGAVYDSGAYQADMAAASRGAAPADLRPAYGALGLGSWPNLPGTLSEIRAIADLVPGTRSVSGAAASEKTVKDLSAAGTLKQYRVLHFATHGIAVPDAPDLSALVLTQPGASGAAGAASGLDDGYLTMPEIEKLDLAADFVNLSACETGLGRVYSGEGSVGLPQAFLVAGANSLSASLWSVSDAATARYMTGLYRLVQEKGLSYAQAGAEMKRAFLRGAAGPAPAGEDWTLPYYWAPFAHYGN